MMNKIVFLLLVTFLPFVYAGNFSLQKGVGVNDTNLHELAQTSWEYAKSSTTQKKYDDGFAVAFLRVAGLTDLYSLSGSNKLYLTNFDTRDVLGNWPLTPWAYRLKMQGEGTNWEVQKGLQGVYGIEKPLEPIDSPVSDELPYQLDAYNDYLGCLSKTPLRYGDFDNDAQTELMLFLNNDLVVFSPQKEKIVFSTTLAYKDELAESQLGIAFGESREDLIFQYYSAQGSLKPFTAPFAAQRSYAKVYVGNFENKDTYDVIVWRKLYHSRLNSDPIKGFEHNADLLIHYQRNELGEYLPQDTRPETIQSWLNAKNLTWQKGFPSKSECAGEEGKLIPEMHDPLLNDPDVLK